MADEGSGSGEAKRRRASKADKVSPEVATPAAPKPKSLQSHGKNSKVYVPVILKIFKARYRPGASSVLFSLDDVRNAVEEVRAEAEDPNAISSRNPADVVYRMRSRTVLPDEILKLGFHILRPIGRGQYQFEKAVAGIIEPPATTPTSTIDTAPMPVRRLLPETVAEMDEQALLSVISYCRILDHFTGMTIYRLRSHVRKSVPGVGQAELDAIDVGIAKSDDDIPIIFPIEAKAVADALNRVQIHNMVQYARRYFPGLTVRPLAVKVDYQSVVHVLEFNAPNKAADLKIVKANSYLIATSSAQIEAIRATNAPRQ